MKKIFFVVAILCTIAKANAQTCCGISSSEMQVFASQKDFQASHAEPLPYVHTSLEGGQMINFSTASGEIANGYFLKAKRKSKKYLLVYQEWWGLNDHIKRQADIFYNDLGGNVNVLAVDLYDGKVANTREEAGKYMSTAKPERLKEIIEGAQNYAGKKAKLASIGWCFGGEQSLKSAIYAGKKAVACVMYYGMPVKDVELLKTLQTDVLGIFAAREKWISPTVVKQFEADMKTAGKKINVLSYDAEHAFANPSNPNFDVNAAAQAYEVALNYLKNKFLF
jgi:carboxymethylenebutenolidase